MFSEGLLEKYALEVVVWGLIGLLLLVLAIFYAAFALYARSWRK